MEDEWVGRVSSLIASTGFLWFMVSKFLEPFHLDEHTSLFTSKLVGYFFPYIEITFPEKVGDEHERSEAYSIIEKYLGTISTKHVKRFKAEIRKDQEEFDLCNEEVIDSFKGIKFWWTSNSVPINNPSFSFHQTKVSTEKRDVVYSEYLKNVTEAGKKAAIKKRQRKVYTKNPEQYRWIPVPFEHPATFDTIAMDPKKKQDIIDGLLTFIGNKDYYKRIGKAWKRGYLLYGSPGTGKSSMVAAIANFLDYDIYDLELTAVTNNFMLKELLIDISNKSITVIEDIDCWSDLTGKRKAKEKRKTKEEEEEENGEVTLSGLLNFLDGFQVVFSHSEQVLDYNYLDIKQHPLFAEVENLMAEVKITPADVAENLIPKHRLGKEGDATICLENLIQALVECKANPIIEDLESNEEDDEEIEKDTTKNKKTKG